MEYKNHVSLTHNRNDPHFSSTTNQMLLVPSHNNIWIIVSNHCLSKRSLLVYAYISSCYFWPIILVYIILDADTLLEHHAIPLSFVCVCRFLFNLLLFIQVNKWDQDSRQNSQLNYKPPLGQRNHTHIVNKRTDLHSILEWHYRKLQLILKLFLLQWGQHYPRNTKAPTLQSFSTTEGYLSLTERPVLKFLLVTQAQGVSSLAWLCPLLGLCPPLPPIDKEDAWEKHPHFLSLAWKWCAMALVHVPSVQI